MKILLNDQQKMDEIIFAKRNKSYGAYVIRASYNSTLFRALFIVTSSMLTFMLVCYALVHRDNRILSHLEPPLTQTTICNLLPPDAKKIDPPKTNPKSPKSAATSTTVRDTVNDQRPEVTEAKPFGRPDGDTAVTAPEPFAGGPSGGGATPAPEKKEEVPTTLIPDEAPVFEGGPNGLTNYLARNTIYPTIAVEANHEGTVYVSFIVNEKGYIENVKVIKGIGLGCDEEAARVVSRIPKAIKPGTVGGRAVKVQYNVPIKFRLK